jgi:hypothetical protein
METSETAATMPVETGHYGRIAHPVHTSVYSGKNRADRVLDATDVNRVFLYARTMVFEWALVGFIVLGVRRNGSPLSSVFGERWRSVLEVARDLGIGVVFLLVPITLGAIFGGHGQEVSRIVQLMLPRNGLETMMWIALSLTAGICEEVISRGYLQRQFSAATSNVAIAIVLQGIIFGAQHLYQGAMRAFPIALLGVALGMLAHWRKSARPGMVSHALQDTMALFMRH